MIINPDSDVDIFEKMDHGGGFVRHQMNKNSSTYFWPNFFQKPENFWIQLWKDDGEKKIYNAKLLAKKQYSLFGIPSVAIGFLIDLNLSPHIFSPSQAPSLPS